MGWLIDCVCEQQCAQRRLGSARASVRSNQRLRCPHEEALGKAHSEDSGSVSADAQADLGLRWADRSFYWFCHSLAHL